jgi:REP element-mobilizing transposase RayT
MHIRASRASQVIFRPSLLKYFIIYIIFFSLKILHWSMLFFHSTQFCFSCIFREKMRHPFPPMMIRNQTSFFDEKPHRAGTKARLIQRGLGFGGEIRYRKKKRPFSLTKPTHIVLHSSLLSGSRSLLKSNRKAWVDNLIQEKAAKYEAKLYKFSVNSNHLHLLLKFTSEIQQANFLRDLAGSMAHKIKRAFKLPKEVKVWSERPFSKVLTKGAYPWVVKYIERNQHETTGFWESKPRPISELIRALEKFTFKSRSRKEMKDSAKSEAGGKTKAASNSTT